MLLETLAEGVVAYKREATRERSRFRHLGPENKLVYARFSDQSSKNLAVLPPGSLLPPLIDPWCI